MTYVRPQGPDGKYHVIDAGGSVPLGAQVQANKLNVKVKASQTTEGMGSMYREDLDRDRQSVRIAIRQGSQASIDSGLDPGSSGRRCAGGQSASQRLSLLRDATIGMR